MSRHYLNLSRWVRDLDLAPADRAVLHSMVDEVGIDAIARACEDAAMNKRSKSLDRPQPRPFAGRGKVVIRDAWNVENAGSIPAAQTTTRTTG